MLKLIAMHDNTVSDARQDQVINEIKIALAEGKYKVMRQENAQRLLTQ